MLWLVHHGCIYVPIFFIIVHDKNPWSRISMLRTSKFWSDAIRFLLTSLARCRIRLESCDTFVIFFFQKKIQPHHLQSELSSCGENKARSIYLNWWGDATLGAGGIQKGQKKYLKKSKIAKSDQWKVTPSGY